MARFDTIHTTATDAQSAEIHEGLRAHMNKVYGIMSVGMLVTAAVAWGVGTSDALSAIFRDPITGSPNILGWVAMFLPLGMVFLFGGMINRISAAAAQTFFYVFAAAMGLSISWIFAVFTGISIAQTFVATSAGFAALSLWGYTTKRDLSGFGSFLMMGLIGLIIAMVINLFVASSALAFAVSVIGVLIFAGLTAYDTQRIKTDYLAHA
ncbi:MAG: Bax inhibitor-1/YccA family protein, partial [Boseongicola sp.]|nr:Bax inhibitor-1/YccA family protein [Boseongicola sp.]